MRMLTDDRPTRLGLLVALALILTSGLFAVPVIATQLDFAHSHPEGTPPHVHELTAIFVAVFTVVAAVVGGVAPVVGGVAEKRGEPVTLRPSEPPRSRAPPSPVGG